MAAKTLLPWYINIGVHVTMSLKNFPRYILGKVAKFGGHSLNGFEVIKLFSEGGPLKRLPRSE